jgi:hypothetical protein
VLQILGAYLALEVEEEDGRCHGVEVSDRRLKWWVEWKPKSARYAS